MSRHERRSYRQRGAVRTARQWLSLCATYGDDAGGGGGGDEDEEEGGQTKAEGMRVPLRCPRAPRVPSLLECRLRLSTKQYYGSLTVETPRQVAAAQRQCHTVTLLPQARQTAAKTAPDCGSGNRCSAAAAAAASTRHLACPGTNVRPLSCHATSYVLMSRRRCVSAILAAVPSWADKPGQDIQALDAVGLDARLGNTGSGLGFSCCSGSSGVMAVRAPSLSAPQTRVQLL
jgi:hypothetical protein